MSRNIQVSERNRQAVADQSVEIVERKGVGHPDSISDGIAEAVSRALSELYLDRVGKVLHYNTDETQLVAGRAAPAFGGGEVIEPIYLLIVGRATKEYDGQQLPVDATALTAARDYLDETIPELDPETDVIVDVKLGAGSGDLQEVFGEDGVDAVETVRAYVTDLAAEITDRELTVDVNTADDYEAGSIYLTVTGTSAEQGDDGSVGRGNRANGLITPNRPMSMEATSGKNPVNHIGKIYNLLSTEIAESVVSEVDGIRDLQLRLLSQIGQPIDQPHVADAQVVTANGVDLADRKAEIEAIIDRELADVTEITRQVIDGELSTF